MPFAFINLSYPDYSYLILIIFLVIGCAALNYGGDFLTDGAVALANIFHISKAVIGLTIVSMATSMPEMITSLLAAGKSPGLAIGNILGSNIANIGLILGITALIVPLTVQKRLIRREMSLLIAVSALFIFFAMGGFSRLEGFVMLAIMAIYLFFVVRWAKQESRESRALLPGSPILQKQHSLVGGVMYVISGGVLLAIGADTLVNASVEIAGRLGVSDVLIGLTIVAIGTSLPELAASVSAARSGNEDICVGNIIGSNLFNILLIGGGVASLIPIPVDSQLFRVEFPAMMLITIVFLWLATKGRQISGKEGIFLLALYFTILGLSSFFQLKN